MTKRREAERPEDPPTPQPSPQTKDTSENDDEIERGLEAPRLASQDEPRAGQDEPGAITILVPPKRT